MKTASYRTLIVRGVPYVLAVVLFLNLLAAAQDESLSFDPLDKDGRLKALTHSEKWEKASTEERERMEKEIYDDWIDYGGTQTPERRQRLVTFDPRKGFGRVAGRVVDDLGKPLRGVSVSFKAYELGPGVSVKERRPQPVITDNDGRFSAPRVYAYWNVIDLETPWKFSFPYYMTMGEDLSRPETLSPRDLDTTTSFRPEVAVLVEKDKTTDIGDVVFKLPLTIRGRVTVDGKPQADVCVMRLKPGVQQIWSNTNAVSLTDEGGVCLTDKDGRFECYVFPPCSGEVVIGIAERTGVFKTAGSFMAAKSFVPRDIGPERTTELNFDLKPFAQLEFDIECEETDHILLEGVGGLCYFYEKGARGSRTDRYFYALETLERSKKRTFRIQPGTYDICLADFSAAPWLWMKDVVLNPGEKRREKFLVNPDEYVEIAGIVTYRYGTKEFTMAEMAAASDGFGIPGLGCARSNELTNLRGFLRAPFSLFQILPGSEPARILPFVTPMFQDGKFRLFALRVPESRLELWTLQDGRAITVVSGPITFWNDVWGNSLVEPGIATVNRMRKVWEQPMSAKSVPASLEIRVSLIDLLHAFMDKATEAEAGVAPGSDEESRATLAVDLATADRKRNCSTLRDFLLNEAVEAGLSDGEKASLEKLLARLAEYENSMSFKLIRPR